MKLCSFGLWSKFLRKILKFGYLNPFFEDVKCDAPLWLMVYWKVHSHFLFALIELPSPSITVRSYEAKYVQLGCFRREVDLFALKFYQNRVVFQQPFLVSEN